MTDTPSFAPPRVPPLRFVRRGQIVSLDGVAPSRTLLALLREDLGQCGTKEGCGEGGCGACAVVLGELENGALRYRAVNSCIRLAHSIDGMALWTVEDLAADTFAPAGLHPVQEAMVQCHASQCGFCTPGFVMSLFALYQSQPPGMPVSRAQAQEALSGNLCRCTGYRPILDAAQAMTRLPAARLDEAAVLAQLNALAPAPSSPQADSAYQAPRTLADLLRLRAAHPQAQLVAGCTDVGLWLTQQQRQFAHLIDLTRVSELRRIDESPQHLTLGTAVTLQDAFAALLRHWPSLHSFAGRFAGLLVRNAGTLGGNVANGSPIGDAMPLLIALGASVVLASVRGQRELPLEKLYTGYRQNVMAADEVLGWIKVPLPASAIAGSRASIQASAAAQPAAAPPAAAAAATATAAFLRAYKISKRQDDDISAVCLVLHLHLGDGVVQAASIGVGGVAATPVRAVKTQAALIGQPWTQETVQSAIAVLRAEFTPLSDMRASAAYRTEVLGQLLQRYWLESQGHSAIDLATFTLEDAA